MLHHPEPGHIRQHVAQLGDRLAVAFEERVHQRPAAGVGYRSEHVGCLVHGFR